jgi:hypothetical protein
MVSPEGGKEQENKNWQRAQELRRVLPQLRDYYDLNDSAEVRSHIGAALGSLTIAAELLAPTPKPPKVEKIRRPVHT